MMLTEGVEADVLDNNCVMIVLMEQGLLENLPWVLCVSLCQELHRLCHTLRGL